VSPADAGAGPGCAWSAADDPQGDSGGALDESAGVVEELIDVLTVGPSAKSVS